jgi:hypothetical protein
MGLCVPKSSYTCRITAILEFVIGVHLSFFAHPADFQIAAEPQYGRPETVILSYLKTFGIQKHWNLAERTTWAFLRICNKPWSLPSQLWSAIMLSNNWYFCDRRSYISVELPPRAGPLSNWPGPRLWLTLITNADKLLTEENRKTQRKTFACATLSKINPHGLPWGANPGLYTEKITTNQSDIWNSF